MIGFFQISHLKQLKKNYTEWRQLNKSVKIILARDFLMYCEETMTFLYKAYPAIAVRHYLNLILLFGNFDTVLIFVYFQCTKDDVFHH